MDGNDVPDEVTSAVVVDDTAGMFISGAPIGLWTDPGGGVCGPTGICVTFAVAVCAALVVGSSGLATAAYEPVGSGGRCGGGSCAAGAARPEGALGA